MTWVKSHKGIVAAAIIGLFVGVAVGGGGETKTTTETQATTITKTVTRTSPLTADARQDLRALRSKIDQRAATLRKLTGQVGSARAEAARNTVDGTGTFVVGADINPGTYRAAAQPGCYWARLNSLDSSDIADNDNADGPVVVQILPSDKAFKTEDCAKFRKVG